MKKPPPLERMVADLIDGAILIAVKLIAAGAFFVVSDRFSRVGKWGNMLCITLWIFYLVTITLVFFIYYIYFFTKYGASPGKIFFDLRVVDDKSNGSLTKRQSFLRALGYLISGAPLYLGFVWILFDRKGQGWHDKIAGTRLTNVSNTQ
jgi:uncharacterized RDD family membrane protein YckC